MHTETWRPSGLPPGSVLRGTPSVPRVHIWHDTRKGVFWSKVAGDPDQSTVREESKRKAERRSRRKMAHRRVAMVSHWPNTRLVIWGSSMFPRRPTGLTPGSVLRGTLSVPRVHIWHYTRKGVFWSKVAGDFDPSPLPPRGRRKACRPVLPNRGPRTTQTPRRREIEERGEQKRAQQMCFVGVEVRGVGCEDGTGSQRKTCPSKSLLCPQLNKSWHGESGLNPARRSS